MGDSIISIDIGNEQQLKSLVRVTNLYSKSVPYDATKKSFAPFLIKGNIVLCDFIGFGKELDLPHYAIVWNSNGWDENINVIPLTSQFKNESKNISNLGKIKNFMTKSGSDFINKNSFIYLNRIMEVSRARVKLMYQEDTSGNKLRNEKGKLIPVELDESTINRISKSLKLLYLNEGDCLVDLLLKFKGDNFLDLTSLNSSEILNLGYRYIDTYKEYNFDDKIILIFFIEGKRYSLTIKKINWDRFNSEDHAKLYSLVKYHKNFGNRKRNIINSLFSTNTNLVLEAKKIITDLY